MKIVHVVECWDAGVQTAVGNFVRLRPESHHYLIGSSRHGAQFSAPEFDDAIDIGRNGLVFVPQIRQALEQFNPDLIHLHSSFAGAFLLVARPNLPVVWTPHTRPSRRRDIGVLSRSIYRFLERLIVIRADHVAAASLAESVGLPASTTTVVGHVVPTLDRIQHSRPSEPRVIGVGRLVAAKGVERFAELADANPSARFAWIGDGDVSLRKILEQAHVEVSGWLPRTQVLERIREASVLISTSYWEVGVSYAMLEAIASKVPVLAVSEAHLTADQCPEMSIVPMAQMPKRVMEVAIDDVESQAIIDAWSSRLDWHREEFVQQRLGNAYSAAMAQASRRNDTAIHRTDQ